MKLVLKTEIVRAVPVMHVTELALRMSLRCAALGITHRQAADRMDVTPARFSFILKSQRLTEDVFHRLCEAVELYPGSAEWTAPLAERVGAEQAARGLQHRASVISLAKSKQKR